MELSTCIGFSSYIVADHLHTDLSIESNSKLHSVFEELSSSYYFTMLCSTAAVSTRLRDNHIRVAGYFINS